MLGDESMLGDNHPSPGNPHPLVVFGGSNSNGMAECIADYLNISLGKADTTPFPDGECMVRIKTDVRHRDVFVVQSVSRQWMPTKDNPYSGINDAFMELLLWIEALARGSAHRITAVIPYFGYARQDRKAAGRTPISARAVADCYVAMGLDRILTMDLHADQIQGFFRGKDTKLDHLNAGYIFATHFTELGFDDAVVLSPDVGNAKKADKYRAGMPARYGMAIVDKRRDPDTGEVQSERLTGDDVEGKTVLMFDDMISTAGTMRAGVDLADAQGAKEFFIAATHGIFVGDAIERLSHPKIKQICITDSIPVLPEVKAALPIKVLSVATLFGEAISRVHAGESISELLGKFG